MTLLPPTPAQQKRMNAELPSDPEIRKNDIRVLRQWLSKQPHLPNHIDNDKLERFLYNCKNNVERCKLILERYYTARTSLPDFFAVRDPMSRDIKESYEVVNYFTLPTLTEEGYRVTIGSLNNFNSDKFSLQALIRRILMILDIRLKEEVCLSNIMVIDLKNVSPAHLAKVSPTLSTVRQALLAIQDCMPFRLHRVHFLHTPSYIITFINLFLPILKQKLPQKFNFHNGGGEELYAYMDKEILPNEWGGKAGTIKELNDAWQEKLEKNRDWFLHDEKLSRTNETARLPELKSYFLKDLEGLQGSFRKLNID
ncbi:alpha-tocopherol transfer protein-like isoform X2 [Pseudomyrmex gracilis]|nr:alpha-tocopherol transfer protein-like isoform X2 [Pseudomyrmex gracilis]XP_020284647.1 alpha-tocopherol transfer protein-like isoform X2 [Pseudomyrmex gracilis]XP_020284648.1 alpha-tocopherol transfer protein-like isoform X2 [Pseudomyrmex gracilis]XP_020284649.1 alpha-tocopherol transfer protein-like isoform X2 [Pseudomyrmex gracilis]